jgi:7-carboxy-7-deazaguanine synthase
MFGKNQKLRPEYGEGKILKVTSIFGTFQGEGPYTGYPSLFIRLSGCNLACSFCDTEFDAYEEMAVEEIIRRAYEAFQNFAEKEIADVKPLVVITGGEPMRQNISFLCKEFIEMGHMVQVESNGTLICPDLPKEVQIVCSPKVSNGKYHKIRSDVMQQVIAIKFIVSASQNEYSNLSDVGQNGIRVYVQPMDEYDPQKNAANLKLAMQLALQNNAILSLQTHKVIGIE